MKEIYVLFLETVFYDLDTHYGNEAIGFYSTEENARKGLDSFIKDHTDPDDGRIYIPFGDEWALSIERILLDCEGERHEVYRVDMEEVDPRFKEGGKN